MKINKIQILYMVLQLILLIILSFTNENYFFKGWVSSFILFDSFAIAILHSTNENN